MEHQKDNIAVTLVCPGFVNTDVARKALTGDGSAQTRQDQATALGMDPGGFAQKMLKPSKGVKWKSILGEKKSLEYI